MNGYRSLFDDLPEPIDLELDLEVASSTGRIAATRRSAIRSIVPRSIGEERSA